MPKDIRSFFSKVPSKTTVDDKSTKQETTSEKASQAEKPDALKQSKAAKQPAPTKSATPRKTAAAKARARTSLVKSEQPTKSKAKRKQILESDSDDDFEDVGKKKAKSKAEDDDFVVDLANDASSDDDDDVMDVDEDDDFVGAKKKRKAAPKPPVAAKASPARKLAASASPAVAKKKAPAALTTPSPASAPAAPKRGAKRSSGQAKAKGPERPADVQAAIDAVDAAVDQLPAEGDVKYTVLEAQEGGGWIQRGGDPAPLNPGSRALPRGHPDCLTGKTFVITGSLESLTRSDAEDLIKRHSGRVTGSVSGKTTFLVAGQDSGTRKVATAKEKGVKIIDEDGLFSLINAAPAPDAPLEEAPPPASISAGTVSLGPASAPSTSGRRMPASFSGRAAPSAPAAAPSSSHAGQSAVGAGAASRNQNGQLWVEKHKPQSSADLIGNPGLIATIRDWLQNWDRIHLRHEEVIAPKRGGGKPKDLTKKAIMLSGPPGIGKTSSALIIARELGFIPVEVNASDTRNKADKSAKGGMAGKLANNIKELADNRALTGAHGEDKKLCLIMDEVDGMSAGDRGGVPDLIQTIKSAKLPIICICNDKYNQKLKSLRNSCLELDFRKPTSQQISKRLLQICQKEGLQVNESTLAALVESSNADIRLMLGQLQMIRLRKRSLSYDDAKGKMGGGKDADMSPFEAGRKLLSLESERLSLNDRIDLVFQDADLVPLLVQENYINHRPKIADSEVTRMKVLAKAADALSAGDLVNRKVRQYGSWGLMPFAAAIGSVYPATYMRGARETFSAYENNFPRFTAWLGMNSSTGKQRRLMGELHTRMTSSGHVASDRMGLRTAYLPTLRYALSKPLATEDKEGIPIVINTMQEYCISREDLDFVMSVTHFKSKEEWSEDPMKGVETKVKSAFTRTFNQSGGRAKCNIAVDEFKRKRGRGKAAAAPGDDLQPVDGEAEPEEAGVAAEEEEEEEDDIGAEQLAQKQGAQLARKGITFNAKGGQVKKGKGGAAGGGKGTKGSRAKASAGKKS
ncbi:g7983 [Coccomyxa elongata]